MYGRGVTLVVTLDPGRGQGVARHRPEGVRCSSPGQRCSGGQRAAERGLGVCPRFAGRMRGAGGRPGAPTCLAWALNGWEGHSEGGGHGIRVSGAALRCPWHCVLGPRGPRCRGHCSGRARASGLRSPGLMHALSTVGRLPRQGPRRACQPAHVAPCGWQRGGAGAGRPWPGLPKTPMQLLNSSVETQEDQSIECRMGRRRGPRRTLRGNTEQQGGFSQRPGPEGGACSGLTVGGNGPMKKLQGEETLWGLDGQAGVLGSEDFSPGNVEGRRVIGSKEF